MSTDSPVWVRCTVVTLAWLTLPGCAGPGTETTEATQASPEVSLPSDALAPPAQLAAEAIEPSEAALAGEGLTEAEGVAGVSAERAFGAPLAGDTAPVPLATLLDQPEQYTGQVVRAEGEISAVCQRMGCWMELRDERERAVRVPMAGHAFFLPRDVAGRRAVVEGALSVRPLSAAEREHLASEGAEATNVALEINATTVVVRASEAATTTTTTTATL